MRRVLLRKKPPYLPWREGRGKVPLYHLRLKTGCAAESGYSAGFRGKVQSKPCDTMAFVATACTDSMVRQVDVFHVTVVVQIGKGLLF